MISKIFFSGKSKKNVSKCCLLKMLSRVLYWLKRKCFNWKNDLIKHFSKNFTCSLTYEKGCLVAEAHCRSQSLKLPHQGTESREQILRRPIYFNSLNATILVLSF